AKNPLSLAFAIPDHPWVDAADGAAVRIAMTVGASGGQEGQLLQVRDERRTEGDEPALIFGVTTGVLHADLRSGPNIAAVTALRSNSLVTYPGVEPHGQGFVVQPREAVALGLGSEPDLEHHIREYRNGRDLTDRPRGVLVIDLFGLEVAEVRSRYPEVYQWIL